MQSGSSKLAKEFKKMRMAPKVVRKPFPSTSWVKVLALRPLLMQSTSGVRDYLFIYSSIGLISKIFRGN